MKTIRVEASRPYDVMVGYGLLPMLGEVLLRAHPPCRVVLVSDEKVFALYGKTAMKALEDAGFTAASCILPSGEEHKTLATVEALFLALMEHGLTRSDLVVSLGGGITGDIVGFAASVYLRGISYVQVPTTLLAAVDASIGGKTGVNLPQGKNLIGAFWQPLLVLCDCDAFRTLPQDDYHDGVAESLKYGIIRDRSIFERIAQGKLEEECLDIVARCVEIKAEIVAQDEHDHGARNLLNFGHTIGHAIEVHSGYAVTHGHAVAMGMAGMTRMAEALGICAMGTAGVVMAMLDRLGLPSEIPYEAPHLATIAMRDKKRSGDNVTLVLPKSIGECVAIPVGIKELPRLMRLAKGARA